MVTCQSRVSLSSSPIWIPSPLLAMLLFQSFLSATHMETNSIYLWHWTLYINASPVFTYHKYSYIYLYDSLTYIIHIVSTSSIISLYPIYIYIIHKSYTHMYLFIYATCTYICIYTYSIYILHLHTIGISCTWLSNIHLAGARCCNAKGLRMLANSEHIRW